MDRYLVAAVVLGVALVLLIFTEMAYQVRDAETTSFQTRMITVHCKTVFEANGSPFPGVMIYGEGSSISDGNGNCTVQAEGDGFVRLIVYPPNGGQKVVTVPVSPEETEVNVVIPI